MKKKKLATIYATLPNKEIAALFGVDTNAIKMQAAKQELRKNKWTEEQRKYLLENWASKTVTALMQYFGKSKWSVIGEYRHLTKNI